ncbi:MAG: FtsB family cell division protein [Acidimicrobiales bacterium]
MTGRKPARAPAGRARPAASPRRVPPSVGRRRARVLLVGAALFAVVVLATGMPVSNLLSQGHQLSSVSTELAQLQSANRTLTAETRRLTDPTTVNALARSEYGMVAPGQKAYVILPPPGSSAFAVVGSGHVPLQGPPVAPGSPESQALLGVQPTSTPSSVAPALVAPRSGRTAVGPHNAAAPGTFWSRVVRTLEFWR